MADILGWKQGNQHGPYNGLEDVWLKITYIIFVFSVSIETILHLAFELCHQRQMHAQSYVGLCL